MTALWLILLADLMMLMPSLLPLKEHENPGKTAIERELAITFDQLKRTS